jgi:hypothetical protein
MIRIANKKNNGISEEQAPLCACCDHPLSSKYDYCDHCYAPLSLTETTLLREGPQRFLSVLGASGAGKTVYLGLLLDLLGSGADRLRGVATSTFSIELQQSVVTALERRAFPAKTPVEPDRWNWVHSEIQSQTQESAWDLISPDIAGESIEMEMQHPGTFPAIAGTIAKSSGLMILCDSLRVRDAGPGEDLFAMKLATYIAQVHGESRQTFLKRKRVNASLAIVFTKCDASPEARENPQRFAENNTPRLVEYCRGHFARHAFFAASVAGSTITIGDVNGVRQQVPLHVEPRGIIEPLQWLTAT